MATDITYRIALEIASHEAIVRQTYYDSVKKPTWSIGLTSATGHVVERYWKKPQSLTHCLRVYVWALENYAHDVREAFEGKELTEEQFGAALSFHWNTGKIKSASWVDSFRQGNLKEARRQFMLYNKPKEIIPRRQKECDLFFEGKWSSDGKVTEYTRVKDSGHIDWSSAKRIDIREELQKVMRLEIPASDKVIVTETKEVEVPVPVPVEKPVVPAKVEKEVRQKTNWLSVIFGALFGAGGLSSYLSGMDKETVIWTLGIGFAVILIVLLGGEWLIRRLRKIADALNAEGIS